jgi:hypothetical protein
VGVTTGLAPCVAWDGANWCVAWFIPGISVARVTPAGAVLNFGGLPIDAGFAATKEEPAIAAAPGGGARVVWTDYRAASVNPKDIYSAAVPSVGQPGPGACISVGAPSQLTPRVASGANGFLAVFLSAVSSGQRILAQRLDAAGAPLDAQPFQIAPVGPNVRNPSVACNGSLYLVVWEDRGANVIYGKRVQLNGTVLDAAPLAIMPGNTPDVAAVGDIFLIVDSHAPSNPQYRFIYSRRLRGSDAALLDGTPVAIGDNFAIIPRVAALNGRWLAVWEGHPTHDDSTANIYGSFVETNGTAGAQLAVTLDGYYVRFHNRPAIAAGPANALVLWTDPRFGNSDWGIFARRVLPDGTVLDAAGPPPSPRPPLIMPATYPGFAVTTAPNDQDRPAAAWDGAQFVTAWEDPRNNTFFVDQRTDVFGARVSGAGTLIDPDGFPLVNTPVPETSPALAALMGRTVSAISCFQEQSPYAAYRVGVRTLSNPAVVPPILRLTRDAAGLSLYWPTNAVGFSLQTAPLATGTFVWGPAPQPITPIGSNYVVTIPTTGAGALYRLRKP